MSAKATGLMQSTDGLPLKLAGTAAIFATGSLLHFAYAWSGQSWPVALLAAVNESTWEHLKLAFWPGLAWAVAYWTLRKPSPALAFWAAQSCGLFIVAALIVVLFYGYTAAIGRNLLVLDIGIFFIAILSGQLAAAALLAMTRRFTVLCWLGLLLLAIQIAAYATFTVLPPPHWLFEDPRNGQFGMAAFRAAGSH